ncbi:unnamed protein product [Clonostachys byssicola]|uniref:Luciferase-like domain-containing protein n=1 Tax=Clonostachys byssicola TaxID=160290 RepID=A0A9N9USK1_9HYPO|nr:unnamed protein product [Clonostachys byssicola]
MATRTGAGAGADRPKKQIMLNAFDMFTPSHLSFGQWRQPGSRAKDKRRDLSYWTDLAKLLEKGGFTSLFLADSYGLYDVYKGSEAESIKNAAQFPIADPTIPISAMAAVTNNLNFAITTSTSYEKAYVVAKRFSTLDHLTNGRFGWNIVTSWKESASKAVGLPLVDHDKRYDDADEYIRLLYKLWEGSWADDALKEDIESGVYTDNTKVRRIVHRGIHQTDAPFIVDPSPQRTPVLFQAGTSPAGVKFGSTHGEGIFVGGFSPHIIAPRVKALRESAAAAGRDPASIKVFAEISPFLGRTEEEARDKYDKALEYGLVDGGLAMASASYGFDLSKFDPDHELQPEDITNINRVRSQLHNLQYRGDDVPKLTPRNLGILAAVGGSFSPTPVGTAEQVADVIEKWVEVADVDGFNIGHIVTPQSYIDVVELLIPELRRRGIFPQQEEASEPLTFRERIYGKGQRGLRSDHPGYRYRYDNYETAIKEDREKAAAVALASGGGSATTS